MNCQWCGAEQGRQECLDCIARNIDPWPHEGQTFRILVDRAKIIETLWEKHLLDKEIAAVVGIHPDTVRIWRERLELPHRVRRPLAEAVTELWKRNYSDVEIARELGVNVATPFRWRKRLDLPPNR